MQRRVVPLVSCLVAGVCFLAIACPATVTISACDGKTNGGCLANAQCIASATNEATCKCPQGFEGDGKTSCTQVATCTIVNGAILCTCLTGYSGNGTTCTKDNACSPDPCDPNATCATAPSGGPICTCKMGFVDFDGGANVSDAGNDDSDAGDAGTNNADAGDAGSNLADAGDAGTGSSDAGASPSDAGSTPDSGTSDPDAGTTSTAGASSSVICIPVAPSANACSPNPCNSNATCTIGSVGQAVCKCDTNYTGGGTDPVCLAIPNGCIPDPCGTNSTCANDAGTPTCTCVPPYLSPSGHGNDCRTGNPGDQCSEGADCLTGVCLTSDECSFAQCTVPSPTPSQGSCVILAPNAPDAGQDAGLDDAGNASVTVCNPVTNAGCSGGDQCGLDNSGQYFFCQPDAGLVTVAACNDCTSSNDTCAPGMICTFVDSTDSAAQCAPLCCSDDDCGDAGACAGLFPDGGISLGVCSQF